MSKKKNMVRGLTALLLPIAMTLTNVGHATENYPNKAIKVVMPWPAGGGTDTVARSILAELEKEIGQPLYMENKAGATGAIGSAYVANAKPDGYTLVVGTADSHSIVPNLYSNVKYNKDSFVAVAPIGKFPYLLAVNSNFGINNFQEFIDKTKKPNGPFNYASWGVGSSSHIAMNSIVNKGSLNFVHVPYQGAAPAMLGLVSDQVASMVVPIPLAQQHSKTGKIKLIGIASQKRFSAVPDIPTLKEQGMDLDAGTWIGFLAPQGTPKEIVEKLNIAVSNVVKRPEIQQLLLEQFVDPAVMSSEEYEEFIAKEYKLWRDLITDNGISID